MKKLVSLSLLLLACSGPSAKEHQINLAARQIGGIAFAGTLAQIRNQLGNNTIQVIPRDFVSDQGDRVVDTLWVISISGHEFTRFSSPIEVLIQDSVFRTREGLGVGSTVQEFVDHYGIPKFHEEDIGYTLTFTAFNLRLSVYVSPECECKRDFASLDKKCPVEAFYIIVPA